MVGGSEGPSFAGCNATRSRAGAASAGFELPPRFAFERNANRCREETCYVGSRARNERRGHRARHAVCHATHTLSPIAPNARFVVALIVAIDAVGPGTIGPKPIAPARAGSRLRAACSGARENLGAGALRARAGTRERAARVPLPGGIARSRSAPYASLGLASGARIRARPVRAGGWPGSPPRGRARASRAASKPYARTGGAGSRTPRPAARARGQ